MGVAPGGEDGLLRKASVSATGDHSTPMTPAVNSVSLAPLESNQPFDLNVSTHSSLALLADQALAQEQESLPLAHELLAATAASCDSSGRHWCAAVDIRSVPLPPAAAGFSLKEMSSCLT